MCWLAGWPSLLAFYCSRCRTLTGFVGFFFASCVGDERRAGIAFEILTNLAGAPCLHFLLFSVRATLGDHHQSCVEPTEKEPTGSRAAPCARSRRSVTVFSTVRAGDAPRTIDISSSIATLDRFEHILVTTESCVENLIKVPTKKRRERWGRRERRGAASLCWAGQRFDRIFFICRAELKAYKRKSSQKPQLLVLHCVDTSKKRKPKTKTTSKNSFFDTCRFDTIRLGRQDIDTFLSPSKPF